MPVRVGVDLVDVSEVQRTLDRYGERYLSRVYTATEVAGCRSGAGLDAARLAARFAAKEAVMKVLRTGLNWSQVELVRSGDGAVSLALSGAALERARDCRVTALDVSLTHEGGYAAAVVVAEFDRDSVHRSGDSSSGSDLSRGTP